MGKIHVWTIFNPPSDTLPTSYQISNYHAFKVDKWKWVVEKKVGRQLSTRRQGKGVKKNFGVYVSGLGI